MRLARAMVAQRIRTDKTLGPPFLQGLRKRAAGGASREKGLDGTANFWHNTTRSVNTAAWVFT